MRTRAEINDVENISIEKMNETKLWYFGKSNKIDKSLARLIEGKKRTQITPEMEEDITTDPKDIKRIIKEYYELYDHNCDHVE